MGGKKGRQERAFLRQLLPDPSIEPISPSSWWCASLVVVALGRGEPYPIQEWKLLEKRHSGGIQCTLQEASALQLPPDSCEACGESMDEFCYSIEELLCPTSRFLKRACRDLGALILKDEFKIEVAAGGDISDDMIKRCCICRGAWRAAHPSAGYSKRDAYLSALRRCRGPLGSRVTLFCIQRSDAAASDLSVVSYLLTELVPGATAIAVDGCSSDLGQRLRGADAYLLHLAGKWWARFDCRWINDGPAASSGIRAHKCQHHGLTVLEMLRYDPIAVPRAVNLPCDTSTVPLEPG